VDATIDPCAIHRGNRCLGRLCNHATERVRVDNYKCNMKLSDIVCTHLPVDAVSKQHKRIIALVARRDIKPFEQLLFDYGDSDARQAFK